MKKKKYHLSLLITLLIIWIVFAINPIYRDVWIAENILFTIFVLVLVFTYKKFQFSSFSYTLLFFFLVLQTIGSHYSYAEVPFIFETTRNHYDRFVHFIFGLIFYFPIYEFITRKLKIKGMAAHVFTFSLIFALKGLYEIVEWWYVLVTKGNVASISFLGAQGDVWDAQKDMLLGGIGALVSGFFMRFRK